MENMALKGKNLSRREKVLMLLLVIGLIAVIFKWQDVRKGIIQGWERYSLEQWFEK